ncbi:hypothetical protein KV097_08930 [Mumia sp. zg.B17]|uniref:hypothetical protein n=1 Tax=unclassified Mumia TaxID=2621872 RepID=UPI001C6EB2EA|nr:MULTISPECIES: hypothetical protein [unclassified Mumia]MBW9206070.1 hypothetical protein [Mumia sp. zg.B17]MDD9349245.1 hypothetical protein [Mumia sp.]
MDILRPGGIMWRIARRRRGAAPDPLPWMPELAGEGVAPTDEVGRRPLVVTRGGVVVHVEPAPGRATSKARIRELGDAVYALPLTVSTSDDVSQAPYAPPPGPGTTGGWGHPGQAPGMGEGSSS